MSAPVYHYTDTARLPWILRDGVLRPGRNALGGFPDPDFLWATTFPIPDGTASSSGTGSMKALREGRTRTVRFTLRAENFRLWSEIVADYPAWTPGEVKRLERYARGSNPRTWRCRADALPVTSWLAIETRGWADQDWAPVDASVKLLDLSAASPDHLGLALGDLVYVSERIPQANGNVGYSVNTVSLGEAA